MTHYPTMQCRACDGTGRVALPAELLNTLALLKQRELSAPMLCDALGWEGSPTAANNRLEDLRALGLVARRRVGRVWFYSLKFFSR